MTLFRYQIHKIIGLLILGTVLYHVDWRQMRLVLLESAPLYLLTAFLLNLPNLFIKSFRWKILLASQGTRLDIQEAVLFNLSAVFLGLLTPGRIGELAKALYVVRRHGMTLAVAFAVSVLDRLIDLYLLFTLAMVGLIVLHPFPYSFPAGITGIALAMLVLFDTALSKGILKRLMDLAFRAFSRRIPEKAANGMRRLFDSFGRETPISLAWPFCLTIISYWIFFLQCYLVLQAFHVSLSYLKISLIMSITNLISLLPISFAGLGTRDAALVFLLTPQGVAMEAVMACSAGILLVFYAGSAGLGFLAWWLKPLSLREMRHGPA